MYWMGRRPLRLSLWQGRSPAGNVEAAFAELTQALGAAAQAGASMLTAPEIFLPGYNDDRIPDLAQSRGGPWHERLSGLCRNAGCGLTVGYAERDGDTCFNSAMTFDAAGREIAHYRKIQLFGPRERSLYAPGSDYAIFDIGGIRAALLICYDIEFAPHIRALAERGVRIILCPTANMEPNIHVSRIVVPANAINHGVTIVYANFCGPEGDLVYCGGSLIAGPDGEVLVSAGPGEALLVADLPEPDARLLQTQMADYRPAR